MSSSSNNFVYPCPFSKAYGLPESQAWLLLKIYSVYRFASASLLTFLFYRHFAALLSFENANLFKYSSFVYMAVAIFTLPIVFFRLWNYANLAQFLIFFDIIFITLIMHADGGVRSGIGMLLAIAIAAGGLLIGGRCAFLFAALASISILAEQIYDIENGVFETSSLTYSGMLGVSFFSIVLLSYMLTKRSEQSELLAKQHKITIARLEELNRYIIQHLQSGIIIADESQDILLYNQSILRLLDFNRLPENLAAISSELEAAFNLWLNDAKHNFAIIHRADKSEIQIRFSLLTLDGAHLHMLIFEDIALYNQRIQQSKLASLGRLTASIAHEIRNPLGAISHAAQLLSEAPGLEVQDLRLTEIIQNHSMRVNRIIEDILKLSRRDLLQKQKVSLDTWLPAYFEEQSIFFEEYADKFELSLKVKDQNVYIDPGHLKQILDNLCSNALQYGYSANTRIRIVVDRQNNAPCIHVVDNGPGIAAENMLHLFEPFFTTSHKGTGLGLYISKELAELNQAELSYAKDVQGSCFTLVLANADQIVIEI
jgi:two-component system, NtrC family, sensor histidine kinase PilS